MIKLLEIAETSTKLGNPKVLVSGLPDKNPEMTDAIMLFEDLLKKWHNDNLPTLKEIKLIYR